MRKHEAETIARSGKVTWGEIQGLLSRAYDAGAADGRRASVNKSFSKGTSFNIMWDYASEHGPNHVVDSRCFGEWIGARHCLVEFGEFWEGWRPEQKQISLPDPVHQPARAPTPIISEDTPW